MLNEQVILYKGYKFLFQKKLKDGVLRYRCPSNKYCKANLKLWKGTLLDTDTVHNHPMPDQDKMKRKLISEELKKKIELDTSCPTRKLVKEFLGSGGMSNLPKSEISRIKQTLYRARKKQKQLTVDDMAAAEITRGSTDDTQQTESECTGVSQEYPDDSDDYLLPHE